MSETRWRLHRDVKCYANVRLTTFLHHCAVWHKEVHKLCKSQKEPASSGAQKVVATSGPKAKNEHCNCSYWAGEAKIVVTLHGAKIDMLHHVEIMTLLNVRWYSFNAKFFNSLIHGLLCHWTKFCRNIIAISCCADIIGYEVCIFRKPFHGFWRSYAFIYNINTILPFQNHVPTIIFVRWSSISSYTGRRDKFQSST